MTSKNEAKLLSFSEARSVVEGYATCLTPSRAEMLSLLEAAGMVLAEDLRADRDFPPFPRSTRDGFAVRSADVLNLPARLRRIGEIRAGASEQESAIRVQPGEAVEIMTGAPVPAGTDAVVMVEHTERSGDVVVVQRSVAAGDNVVATGAEARQGDVDGDQGQASESRHRRGGGGPGAGRYCGASPSAGGDPGDRR